MKKGILTISVILLGLINTANTCDQFGSTGIAPENNQYIPVGAKSVSTVTKDKFHLVLDSIEEIYTPIVKAMGRRLVVERKWDDGTVNAYAQQIGSKWKISMFGGLARHKAVTPDGFAVVACHELGHHLGGAPQKSSNGSSWASNEGQADYFGVMKCLRKYMEKDDNEGIVKSMNVPSIVTKTCQSQFTNKNEIAMCKRGAMAGLSLANLFKDLMRLSKSNKFDTPDKNIVRKTSDKHPQPQCRLDTYFAGAVCNEDHYTDVSNTDLHQGICSRKFNKKIGIRPLCWFKPTRN